MWYHFTDNNGRAGGRRDKGMVLSLIRKGLRNEQIIRQSRDFYRFSYQAYDTHQ